MADKRPKAKPKAKAPTDQRAAPEPGPTGPRAWLWFRNEDGGRLKAREEFEQLPTAGQAGLALRVDRYLKGESRYKDVDSLGGGIFELRHRHLNNHYRVLFMLWGRHCVALTAFYKNQQQTPKADVDRARTRAARWVELFGDTPEA